MKKWIYMPILILLLSACGNNEIYENVLDCVIEQEQPQPGRISVWLPDGVTSTVMNSDNRQIYYCDDTQIVMEIRPAGDLNATIREMTGYSRDSVQTIQTKQEDYKRFDFIWVSAGESGEELGRGAILDDGVYHYCLSIMRPEQSTNKKQTVWRDVFQSFSLAEGESY